jgi:hypothetical protein
MLRQPSNRNCPGRERRPQKGGKITGNLIRRAPQRRVHLQNARAELAGIDT